MKKIFKKVATIAGSALMLGATLGMAAAANYPAPFVQNGNADVAIVYGANADLTDTVGALNIQTQLATRLAAQTASGSSGSVSVSGNAASLASGSNFLYLNDTLNSEVQTITKDDLPTILADGTFVDDDGTSYDYEQLITMGGGAKIAFGTSSNDLDDPELMLTLPTSASTPIYTLSVTFDEAVNFTDSASEGETIELFGKTYTVGTATDSSKLVLLGGSDAKTVNIGETSTFVTGDESYQVTLNGISDATTPAASITINGESKTFTQGQTKSFSGGDVDVFVKTIFRTGENSGYVELQVGADKLTFEDGKVVKEGANDESIKGTLVSLDSTTATTQLSIAIAAPDTRSDYTLVGDSFMDPVFGSVKINLASIANGPVLSGRTDASGRNSISIERAGNRELQVVATDKSGNTATLPFTYQNNTADDSGTIHVWEGAQITQDDYFILNSGSNQHFMQMDYVYLGNGVEDEIEFTDLFTGTTYSVEGSMAGGKSKVIGGQTYNITNVSATAVTFVTSDYDSVNDGSVIAVYPYIELVNGEDHRFAYVDDVQVLTNFNSNGTDSVTLQLPTGSVTIAANETADTVTVTGDTVAGLADGGSAGVQKGSVFYNFAVASASNNTNVTVSWNNFQNATGAAWAAPGLLFVEDEDKAESVTTTKNAVFLKTTDTGTYSTVSTPVLTATHQYNSAFDDTDYTGYIDSFGTYVLYDQSNSNQDFASLTYPKTQMYANVFVAEESASITGGTSTGGTATELGSVTIKDSEVSSMSSKNLIVVGGSCINSVAANLLGEAACGSAFTDLTSVAAGQFLVQVFDSPYTSGKVAMLVAGYNAADTTKAVTYVTNNVVDTTVGTKVVQ